MINNTTNTAGFVLTLISLTFSSITCITSIIICICIIYHYHYHQLKRQERITLILSADIYSAIFIYITAAISYHIETLLGDLYGRDCNLSWCIFRTYLIGVMLCILYYSFVVQAFYRLCCIVYSSFKWLQQARLYLIVIPIKSIVAFAFVCPVLFWHDIIYLSSEHNCFTLFTNVRAIIWTALTTYLIPFSCLSIIYIRITIFIRNQPNNIVAAVQRRQERDLNALRRILITISLLLVLGTPGIVVIIQALIIGNASSISYRIIWIGGAVSLTVFSIGMVFMDPQLNNIVLRKWKRIRVMPADNILQASNQMGSILTN